MRVSGALGYFLGKDGIQCDEARVVSRFIMNPDGFLSLRIERDKRDSGG